MTCPRRIGGLVAPYGIVAHRWDAVRDDLYEVIEPGALWWDGPVTLDIAHTNRVVGVAERLTPYADGLAATFKVVHGPRGDEALRAARDGVLDGFSVELDGGCEVEPQERDDGSTLLVVRRARLVAVALTDRRVFREARVTVVDAALRTDDRGFPVCAGCHPARTSLRFAVGRV